MGQDVHPMVPVPDAIRIVIKETCRVLMEQPQPSIEISSEAPWNEILDRCVDEDVIMSEPGYPPYNASIMDGFAIRTKDKFPRDGDTWTHQVIDKVYAGDQAPPKQKEGGELPLAYYITTGAVVPDSYDCVVPIEGCVVSPDKKLIRIKATATIEARKWIRPVGCDIPAGSVVLPRGHRMDPIALGLLKQSGAKSIQVKRPIVIGVLSTGNELVKGYQEDRTTGKIPDVNRPILLSLIPSFGNCKVVDLGMERDDDIDTMARNIDLALSKCDIIITTGGISMGESDIVEKVLVDRCGGKLHFGRMHMKPGKPTTFVTIRKDGRIRIVFAMPGNPVSATVCTHLLVKPCLDILFHGVESSTPVTDDLESKLDDLTSNALIHPEIEARLAHDVILDSQRPEYHRVTLATQADGSFEASTTGVQRSSRLISCRDASGLLVLPAGGADKPKALKGETYPVLLLGTFGGVAHVRVRDSLHLKMKARDSKVAVVKVVPEELAHLSFLDETCDQVVKALSGSKSGGASIVSRKTFSGALCDLYSSIVDSNSADFIIVICASFEGCFRYHLDVSSSLRSHVEKAADALALQARQGAASQDPTAALFECFVGYSPERQGAMVVCLPDRGLYGALNNIRGLIKHALNVARGKPHNHHHSHKNHDHLTTK